jgi:hypothetical protein
LHGESYFVLSILKSFLADIAQVIINKFDSVVNGYNIQAVGNNPADMSETTKPSPRKHSEETKLKMSLVGKGKKKKPLTKEHKEKLRQSQVGRNLLLNSEKLSQRVVRMFQCLLKLKLNYLLIKQINLNRILMKLKLKFPFKQR